MKFVTNNVNIILMSAIVLIAIFGVAYYNYQEVRFQKVHEQNVELKAQVAELQSNLSAQENRLKSIFGELQSKLQDSVKFENLYGQITSERDSLQQNLTTLQARFNQERSDRVAAENQARQYSNQISDLKTQNTAFRNSLTQCTNDLNSCQTRLNACLG